MATVNKDFKIKNGLIVEGANGTINGYDILTKEEADQTYIIGLVGGSANSQAVANTIVLRDGSANFAANVITATLSGNVTGNVTGTVSDLSNHDTDDLGEGTTNLYFSNARAKDAAADLLTSATLTNITITGSGSGLTISAENGVADSDTDDLVEGTTNLYFSNARVRDAVGAGEGLQYDENTGVFTAHLGYGLEIANNAIRIDDDVIATDADVSTAISNHNASSGVHGVTGNVVGTNDTQTLSNKTLGSNLDAGTYKITNLGTPENSTDAATKAYVDAVSEGLHIHPSVNAATTENISISADLEAGDVIDGVTLVSGNRVLVKDQTTASQNGIYVVQPTGAAVRAADFDQPAEVDGGDFVFVTGGNTYDNTGWVQTSTGIVTIGSDPIVFTQFSGAGTFLAGYGLYLDGNTFNANSNVLANLEYVANAVSDHSNLTTGVHGVSGNVVGTSDTQTLTNKTLGNAVSLGADLDAVNTYKIVNLQDPTSNQDAATKYYVDNEISNVSNTVANLTTDSVAEGNNLYFTNNRVDTYINDSIDTDDISEGTTNLYFTNARAEAAMVTPLTTGTQTNITVSYDAMSGTYDFVAENGVADSDTDDLAEGTTNLYFSNARAVDALEAVVPNFTEVDINSVATQVAATLAVPTASTVTAYDFAHATYRSAKFLVKAETASHTELSEILVTLDAGNNIAITEYAEITTNGNLFNVTADIDGADVRIRVTTTENTTDITVVGTLVK
jgi:hypothetical protein